jgi:hypothetical protein
MNNYNACFLVMFVPSLLAEINVEFSFASSSSDPIPFNAAQLLEALSLRNSTNSELRFQLIAKNETLRVVNASYVICIDGKCVDDAKVLPAVPSVPEVGGTTPGMHSTPRPNTNNNDGSGISPVIIGVIAVSVGLSILSTALCTFFINARHLKPQTPPPKPKTLMHVEIDWPRKNPYQTKTGTKASESFPV